MADSFLFPRLPAAAARTRFSEVAGKAPAELSALVAASHRHAVYAATGGTRVREQTLVELRQRLVDVASEFGFPGDARRERIVAFDSSAARILSAQELLPIGPGEASREDVWAFMTLVLLPDLATWRFRDQQENRLLGGTRNTFQRLWWRAYVLRDSEAEDPLWLVGLAEDALVGLMERPGLSSNPAVTVVIGRAIAALADSLPADVREDGWRDAYKRIRQRLAFVSFDGLPPEELRRQLEQICAVTVKVVQR